MFGLWKWGCELPAVEGEVAKGHDTVFEPPMSVERERRAVEDAGKRGQNGFDWNGEGGFAWSGDLRGSGVFETFNHWRNGKVVGEERIFYRI